MGREPNHLLAERLMHLYEIAFKKRNRLQGATIEVQSTAEIEGAEISIGTRITTHKIQFAITLPRTARGATDYRNVLAALGLPF